MDDQLTPTQFIRAVEKARLASDGAVTGTRARLRLMIAKSELDSAKRVAKKAGARVAEWQAKVDLLTERAQLSTPQPCRWD